MADLYRSLAQRARERGRLKAAVALLQRAVDAGPRQPMLRLELARVLAESGNRQRAEANYRAVADSEVTSPEAMSLAGDVAERLGRAADARHYFTRYLEVAPDGADAVRIRERLRVLGRPSGPP
jgi:Tfp pilus assembly protein PilF